MNWREWIYAQVVAAVEVPERLVFGAGGLNYAPAEWPFVTIMFGARTPGNAPGTHYQPVNVWVHDKPGTFDNIDRVLQQVKEHIDGQVSAEGAVAALWESDSNDLADDGYGTITRYTTLRLVGRGS